MLTRVQWEKFPKLEKVASDKSRPIMHSIFHDGERMIATNGYCLAVVTPSLALNLEPAIIPLDAIQALAGNDALSIEAGVVTVVGSYVTRTWQVHGKYPDVDQIIPKTGGDYIELDARALAYVANQVHKQGYIVLDSAGVVTCQSDNRGGKLGDSKSIDMLGGTGSFSIAINAGMLLDVAKAIMLPVKANRKNTYPIRLYAQRKQYGPHVVEPVASQERFTSYGVIMPMHN